MDEQEYREQQRKWDEASLDNRVGRWKQLVPAVYDTKLPDLLWEYVTEADEMYINGHFIGVILLCAGILELVFADQLKTSLKLTKDEVDRFRLEQMEILSHRLKILGENEMQQVREIRRLRNYLIHAKAGKINEMAKKRYKDWGIENHNLDSSLFLNPPWEGGLDQEAIKFLLFTRNLTVKFYGTEER